MIDISERASSACFMSHRIPIVVRSILEFVIARQIRGLDTNRYNIEFSGSIECGRLGPQVGARCIEFRRGCALCHSQSKEVICSILRECANGIMLAARDEIRVPGREREKKQLHRGTKRRRAKEDAQPCHGSLSRPGITLGKYCYRSRNSR